MTNPTINRNIAIVGITKHTAFTDEQNELSGVFKALGHPARLAIIEQLIARKSCVCGDLVDVIPLSQATVSQHLKELKQAGLIQGEVEGTSVCYCVNQLKFNEIKQAFTTLMASVQDKTGCC